MKRSIHHIGRIRRSIGLAIAFCATAGLVQAGTITSSTNAPSPDTDDIAQLTSPGADWDNIGGVIGGSNITSSADNDAYTYVANDRTTQGQIFTTGTDASGYVLTHIHVQHVGYTNYLNNGTWSGLSDGTTIKVRVLESDGAGNLTELGSENATVATGSGISGGGSWNGTGKWLDIELASPVVLTNNTQYAFDLTSYGPWFELAGMGTNDLYSGGDAYTTASKEDTSTGTEHATADRTFMLEVVKGSDWNAPPFHDITVSPSGSGTTNPVVLTAVIADWDSEFDSVELTFDGSVVTPDSINTVSGTTTVSYAVSGLLDPLTTHTGKVVVAGINPVGYATNEWTFTMLNALDFVSGSPTGAGASDTPTLEVVIADALCELDTGSVGIYLDGASVSIDSTNPDTPAVGQTTISATWGGTALAAGSTHTGMVVYAGTAPSAGPFTNTWTFSVGGDPGYGIYIGDTNAPTPGADDVYQFAYADADWDNIGGTGTNDQNTGYNDASTYVAGDRNSSQGQLFTTGASASYELSSVWVKHVGYTNIQNNGTWASLNQGEQVTLRIVDPSQADAEGFVVASEALAVVTNEIQGGAGSSPYWQGTGRWIELKFQNPVTLSGSTQYGFDLTSHDNAIYFELAGLRTNGLYSGGAAYTTGSKEALNTGTEHAVADRTFMVKLTAGGAGVTPNIQTIAVSGGSATLTWDSEAGVTYKILSKTNLNSASWSEAKTGISGAGASTSDSVTVSGADQEFFKIEGN